MAPPVVCVSGRQAGGGGSAAANIAGTSTAISYRLNTPSSRSAAAITARPSGRQAGVTTRARGFDAIERTARVATSTITISDCRPITCRSTAMVRPSGDQRGALNCVSGSEMSVVIAGLNARRFGRRRARALRCKTTAVQRHQHEIPAAGRGPDADERLSIRREIGVEQPRFPGQSRDVSRRAVERVQIAVESRVPAQLELIEVDDVASAGRRRSEIPRCHAHRRGAVTRQPIQRRETRAACPPSRGCPRRRCRKPAAQTAAPPR